MKQRLEEFVKDDGCVGNATKLRWNRRRLGLSQQEFARKIGLTQPTISKLERDDTAWATLHDDTVDKIMSFYASMSSWQPERADRILREINEPVGKEVVVETEDVADITEEPAEKVLDVEPNKMNRCEMLISSRRKLGMSQTEFSVKAGVCEKTVRRLEKDETAWDSVRESTVDKIMNFCSSESSCQSEKMDKVYTKPQDEEEPIMKSEVVVEKKVIINKLSKQDEKTLALIEFAYEELTQAKTHDEFVDAIQMLRKIMNRY